jgi:uncharacterized coiled-coil protein SlyX
MEALATNSLLIEFTARLMQLEDTIRAFHDATIRHLDSQDSDIERLNRQLTCVIEAFGLNMARPGPAAIE